jgi:hypothetical protein
LAATLRVQVVKLQEQSAALCRPVEKLAEARAALQAATLDANSPGIAASIVALGAGISALERAVVQLAATREHIAAYGAALGFDLGGTDAGTIEGRPAPGFDGSRGRFDEHVRAPEVPDPIRRAARTLPERPERRGPTRGWLLDADLRLVDNEPIRSGSDNELLTDLDLDGQERRSRSLLGHVEAFVAARMRRGEAPREAMLVINNDVCLGPLSCDRLLPGILPPGARLAIYESTAEGIRLFKVYEGTGERIKR